MRRYTQLTRGKRYQIRALLKAGKRGTPLFFCVSLIPGIGPKAQGSGQLVNSSNREFVEIVETVEVVEVTDLAHSSKLTAHSKDKRHLWLQAQYLFSLFPAPCDVLRTYLTGVACLAFLALYTVYRLPLTKSVRNSCIFCSRRGYILRSAAKNQ